MLVYKKKIEKKINLPGSRDAAMSQAPIGQAPICSNIPRATLSPASVACLYSMWRGLSRVDTFGSVMVLMLKFQHVT